MPCATINRRGEEGPADEPHAIIWDCDGQWDFTGKTWDYRGQEWDYYGMIMVGRKKSQYNAMIIPVVHRNPNI